MLKKPKIVVPDVKPLDIDDIIGSPKNRVVKMGVELEGGWKVLPTGVALERDTSVFHGKAQAGFPHIGELPIGPFQPGAMPRWMKKMYPHKVDSSCGMHVHMSFENMKYFGLLMVPEYQETIIDYLAQWAKAEGFGVDHCIWERLAGKTVYCQKKFWPDDQISVKQKDHDQNRQGHRYTIVNYCGRQVTIEVRVLPMMNTVDQAIRAVRQVVLITNACLLVLGKQREKKLHSSLLMHDEEMFEDYIEQELPLTRNQRRMLA